MSYDQRPPLSAFTKTLHEREFNIDELDLLTISDHVKNDDGKEVPAGSMGTVVSVLGEAEALEVEFEEPLLAPAAVWASLIAGSKRFS